MQKQVELPESRSGTAKEIDRREIHRELSKQVAARFLKKLVWIIQIREKYGILKPNRFTKLRCKSK